MSSSILITRPTYDDSTTYLSEWAEELVISFCKEKGVKYFDLYENKANREQFEKILKRHNPKLVALNGHGSENEVCGHNNEPLLDMENYGLATSRIIHALACESSKTLGEKLSQESNTTYLGYDEKFVFVNDQSRSSQPKKDPVLKSFLEPANTVLTTIIKGNSAEEAYQRSQEKYDYWIKYYLTYYRQESSIIISWLLWDKQFQRLKGNKEAKL